MTLTSSSGDLTLAQALADAGATVADLTGNAYDDIVVAGNGRILFDTDISAYTGMIHVSSGSNIVVATATGGIVGMPALVFAEGDRRGVLSKSNDEKSLLLAVTSGMMIIFR